MPWLDALKGVAIIAVVLDHAFIVNDYLLWKHLYFAVSWFILLAGISNTYTAHQRGFEPLRDCVPFWTRRVRSLIGPYLIASIVGYIVVDFGHLSVLAFIQRILLFHSLPPFYFVALLLQFLLAFPLLYWGLFCSGWLGKLLTLGLALLTGSVLSQLITFPWALGAHYLLGASFLYLFILGMIVARPLVRSVVPWWAWVVAGASFLPLLEYIVVRTNGTIMTHPPSNVLLLFAVALASLSYAVCLRFAQSPAVRALTFLGRHSLDIFLYHFLFLLPLFAYRQHALTTLLGLVPSQILLMVVTVPLAIGGSLLLAHLSGRLQQAAARFTRTAREALPVSRGQSRQAGASPRLGHHLLAPADRGRRVIHRPSGPWRI